MERKRGDSSVSRRGQITLFIIIGLLMVIIAFFLLQLVANAQKARLGAEKEKVLGSLFQKEAVRIYIDDCLNDELEQGLILLGKQGRLWDDQPGGKTYFEDGVTGVLYAAGEETRGVPSGRIYYGITNEKYNEFPNAYPCDTEENHPEFCQYAHPNTTVGFGTLQLRSSTIESDLKRYIINRTQECVREFLKVNISRSAEMQDSEPEMDIEFQPEGISVKAEYPLRFRLGNREGFMLSQFDFFYPSRFKQLLDAAVIFPLQFDQKFVDFNYTEPVLTQPSFTFLSERDLGGCTPDGEYYLCSWALHADAYASLGLQMENQSLPNGDDVFTFTPALYSIVNSPFPYEFRIARQNRAPALDYVNRFACPAADYDYLVIQATESDPAAPADPLSEIDIELKAIDPDEDSPRFDFLEFSSDDFRGRAAQPEPSVLKMAADKVAELVAGIYTVLVSASDSNLNDMQSVRILVDRPIETAIALDTPYGDIAGDQGEQSSGNRRYLVSREDPVYLSAIIPGDTQLQAEFSDDARLDYSDSEGNWIDGWDLPDRSTLEGETSLCYVIPYAEEPAQDVPVPECGADTFTTLPDEAIGSILDEERGNPFQEDGTVRLTYNVNYCGTYTNDYSATAEVEVVDCLPYKNLNHPWPSPNEDVTYGIIVGDDGVERTDFRSYEVTDQEDIHPFEATHACCNAIDYTIAGEETVCFRNPEPLCDKPLENGHNVQSNSGYIQVQETQFCNGDRGNVCNGVKRYDYWDGQMICGVNGQNGCSNIADACQGELAFSYTTDSEGNPGWCSGRMGCKNFCDDDGVAALPIAQARLQGNAISDNDINLLAQESTVTHEDEYKETFGFVCGCSSVPNGAPCDKDYDNFFDEICYGGQCLPQECTQEGASWCDNNEETGESSIVTCAGGGTALSPTACDPGEYCSDESGEPECVIDECTPGPAECLRTSSALAEYEDGFDAAEAADEISAEEHREFTDNWIVQCNSIGSGYDEIEVVFTTGRCGESGNENIVLEEERWVGRGCRDTDVSDIPSESKNCYAFDGEWKGGVCDERRGTPYCKIN